jgi:hypothetical protein
MNIALWILQVLLALHTITGAVWKFSNSAQSIPSLNAIPPGAWLALSVVEIVCALLLLLPLLNKRLGKFVPLAAIVIAAEMLMFCGVDFISGIGDYGSMAYWLVVAAFCAFIAYGRSSMRPLR